MSTSFLDICTRVLRSPAFKFIIVIVLVFALTIPLLLVVFLNYERQQYAKKAQNDVGNMWGAEQTIRGPFIIVPTIKRRQIKRKDETRTEVIRKHAVFLPEKLNVNSDVKTEVRKRGIFSIPVYKSTMNFSGEFITPELTRIKSSVDEIVWSEAVLTLLINDVTAIKKTAKLNINDGENSKLFRSGIGGFDNRIGGIHVPIQTTNAQGSFKFSFNLHLNGSSGLNFVPAGGETTNKITSDWAHPSFTGTFLPDTRKISDKGFEATWIIPRLARGQAQSFISNNLYSLMNNTVFGVDFYQPVGFYNLVERSLKYAIGFIAIAFFAVFIMEIQSGHRVHWIQYIFVGLALIIFYLVLLGTSEHIGFELAYACSSLATSILIGSYAASALKSRIRGFSLFAIMAVIYALLYLLLRVEDYAMLIGSIAAFTLLAIVMFTTRNIDWSASKAKTET